MNITIDGFMELHTVKDKDHSVWIRKSSVISFETCYVSDITHDYGWNTLIRTADGESFIVKEAVGTIRSRLKA